MNCKKGDLALWKTRGVLVLILSRTRDGEIFRAVSGVQVGVVTPPGTGAAWNVEVLGAPQRSQGTEHRFQVLSVYDSSLIPIRDQPGKDEMIRIAGLPNKIQEPA